MSQPTELLRSAATRTASGAWESVLAAVRPQPHTWVAPWARIRRGESLATVVLGLYGLIVCIATAGAVLDNRDIVGGLAFLYLLPAAAGLAVAPRRPLDGWLIVTGWMVVLRLLLIPAPPYPVPVLEPWNWLLWGPVLLLGAWAARGRALVGVVLVSGLAWFLCGAWQPYDVTPGTRLPSFVGLAAPLVLGAALGARQRARAALHDQQARTDEALARQGALAERARIAREMHDVVAHSMSMIAVRAETAPYRLGDVPAPVRTEFAEVAHEARQSLAEMQNLLGVLRSDDGAERAPQPGLPDLEQLLRSARAAGAELQWELHLPEVSPALGLSAYRIVQQGMANAAQHAPGAPVRVRVAPDDGVLRIEIVNGRGTTTSSGPGGGNGLPGMVEGAALHGGTVQAAPRLDGGFELLAELPLGAPA